MRYTDLTEQIMKSMALGNVELYIQTLAFGGKLCSQTWPPGSGLDLLWSLVPSGSFCEKVSAAGVETTTQIGRKSQEITQPAFP